LKINVKKRVEWKNKNKMQVNEIIGKEKEIGRKRE